MFVTRACRCRSSNTDDDDGAGGGALEEETVADSLFAAFQADDDL